MFWVSAVMKEALVYLARNFLRQVLVTSIKVFKYCIGVINNGCD